MQDYDTVLKTLLQGPASHFLEQISGTKVTQWLQTELPQVQNLRLDLLGEADSGELIHFELQSTSHAQMPLRMAEYFVRIWRKYGKLPRQIVIYVGETPPSMETEQKSAHFLIRYELVSIRDLDAEVLLESTSLSDNIVAILAKSSNRRESVRRILKRISELSGEAREVAFQQLSVIAGLRRLAEDVREEAKGMPILTDIMDHEIIGPAIRQGRQEGLQASKRIVRSLIEKRFGPMPKVIETQFLALSEAQLEELSSRLFDAKSIKDLFGKS